MGGSSTFQGVSWQNPLGTNQNTLANEAANEAGKISPAQMFQVSPPSRSNPNDPKSSSYTGNQPAVQAPGLNQFGVGYAPFNPTAAQTSDETNVRNQYLQSVQPNNAFAINGQKTPSQYNPSVSSAINPVGAVNK